MARGADDTSGGPRRRTQAERTATANRRMIRAATRLIARQGYTKTSLAQVGKEAGYSGGLVSHHFGSKQGLLRELVGRITGRFYADQILPATEDRSGLEALGAMADTYFDELVVRQERMRALYVLMGEALGPVSEINEVFAELNRGFRLNASNVIRDGMERGEIRSDLDPDAEAALFVGMLRGVALQWMTDPGCFDLRTAAESLKDALRRHLAAREEETT
jgi:AcrR family transcriptional regulator